LAAAGAQPNVACMNVRKNTQRNGKTRPG
jgi:hypothetical protein